MGITDFLDKRNRKKMKLIAASVLALAAADERAFADKNEFITAQESWWYNQWWAGDDKPAEYIANTEVAISYFARYTSSNGASDKFTNKMATNMNNLVKVAKNLNKRCTNQGKPEYANLMAAQAGRNDDLEVSFHKLVMTMVIKSVRKP